jgi:release factor glutamine methyltransferase
MTLREALDRGVHRLQSQPRLRDDAAADAAYLLRYTLAISQAMLLGHPDRVLTPEEHATYDSLLARRLALEPIQYIAGEREFYGLPLRVNPAVLIPRNATEHLVEAVLKEMQQSPAPNQPPRIVDVGTGSGAIAIALAHHLPAAQLTALDISPAALDVATANAERNAVASRIRFLQSDLLGSIAREPAFDAIVSNPPYVPTSDRETLHPQVRDFEPALALFAGPDGLDLYRRLIPQAHTALKPGGLLALEIGYGQSNAIRALLAGWNGIRFVDDLERIPRVVLARKP